MEFSDHSIPGGERAGVATLAADYRTRAVAPVVRDHAVLQPHPLRRIKRTASKKADTWKVPPRRIWVCFLPVCVCVCVCVYVCELQVPKTLRFGRNVIRK